VRVPKGLFLEQAHELRKDRAILKIQESIRTLATQIQQLMNQPTGKEREPPQDLLAVLIPLLTLNMAVNLPLEMLDQGEEECTGMTIRTSE